MLSAVIRKFIPVAEVYGFEYPIESSPFTTASNTVSAVTVPFADISLYFDFEIRIPATLPTTLSSTTVTPTPSFINNSPKSSLDGE